MYCVVIQFKYKKIILFYQKKIQILQPQVPLRLPCYDFISVTNQLLLWGNTITSTSNVRFQTLGKRAPEL